MTGSGLSVLLIDRSAEVSTVVVSMAVLGVLGSAVAELAVAVLDRLAVWDGLTVTTIVMAGALVTPRLARVQFFFLMIRRPPRSTLSLHDALPICSGSETETELATE